MKPGRWMWPARATARGAGLLSDNGIDRGIGVKHGTGINDCIGIEHGIGH